MLNVEHLAIVGGGFSGTLLAINVLRAGTACVTLIERVPGRIARGLAYGEAEADHVLNVRAANMSAFPDQPGHFADWLERAGLGTSTTFATRRSYGAYLADLLAQTRHEAGDRLTILADDVLDMQVNSQRTRLLLGSGGYLDADAAVLAPGNLPPHDPPPLAHMSWPDYAEDPWRADISRGLDRERPILLIGTGLTAIDCALTLDASGFRGDILMLSRRGQLPHKHAPQTPYDRLEYDNPPSVSDLVKRVRCRARTIGWRNAVDELRPATQRIWRTASADQRRRFLRHLRPYWDVHRHRLAPEVAMRLAGMREERRLVVHAGKLGRISKEADGIHVWWRPRGLEAAHEVTVQRIVNCTGPLGDLQRTSDILLSSLRDSGMIRPDELQIGIDVDQLARAVRADGSASERLFVVGPMTRGAYWEIVAVPDIRRQVWDVARYLTNSHWVGGEGL